MLRTLVALLSVGAVAPPAYGLSLATFNLRNLRPDDPPARFERVAAAVVDAMGSPDVVAVQEVADSDGTRASGRTDAEVTFGMLKAALARAGVPDYQVVQADPDDGADGGLPGANIRVAFLVRVLGLAAPPRLLLRNPARLGEGDPTFVGTRKPLVAELTVGGRSLLVMNLHLSSRRGENDTAGGASARDDKRLAQARVAADFVAAVLRARPDAWIAVLGDLNAGLGDAPVAELTAAGLEPLLARMPPGERHTYVYSGTPHSYDHVLTSPALSRHIYDVSILHGLATFAGGTLSDHAPVVARSREAVADGAPGCAMSRLRPGRGPPLWLALWLWWPLLHARHGAQAASARNPVPSSLRRTR